MLDFKRLSEAFCHSGTLKPRRKLGFLAIHIDLFPSEKTPLLDPSGRFQGHTSVWIFNENF
jgi:hypothetical protein